MESGDSEQVASVEKPIWGFLPKQISPYLFVLIVVCLVAFAVEVYSVHNTNMRNTNIGGGTTSYYVNIAENLLKGNGFKLDFVDEFYVKFRSVTHPDEWGLPMMGILTAPFVYFLGKTDLAIKLPSIFIGTILLPIVVFYLGKEFFDRKIGFLAAFSVLFFPPTFNLSFTGQRDIVFSFFLLAAIYFFYRGLKDDARKNFYIMGAFLGLTYYVRHTVIIIIPAIILIYYLIKRKIDLNISIGIFSAILIMLPWLARNYLIFGDPLFTPHKYASWIVASFANYDPIGYSVFWDVEKPSLHWLRSLNLPIPFYLFALYKILDNFALQFSQLFTLIVLGFLGLVLSTIEQIKKKYIISTALILVLALFAKVPLGYKAYVLPSSSSIPYATIFFALPYITILIASIFIFGKKNDRNRLFTVLLAIFALFHGFLVVPELRFFLPLVPFFFIFFWGGTEHLLRSFTARFSKFKEEYATMIIFGMLIVFLIISLPLAFIQLFNKDAITQYKEHAREEKDFFISETIINRTTNDAIIMGCNVAAWHYRTDRKFVELPADTVERIADVVRWYNVSYMLFTDCSNRILDPRLFESVFDNQSLPEGYINLLYKIRLGEKISGNTTVISFNARPVL